jgi:hypothetical protein
MGEYVIAKADGVQPEAISVLADGGVEIASSQSFPVMTDG